MGEKQQEQNSQLRIYRYLENQEAYEKWLAEKQANNN